MKLNEDLLNRLNLKLAAKNLHNKSLDRMPILISDRALSQNQNELIKSINADYSYGTRIASSTISMPRKGFGLRPVTILSGRDRVLYDALTALLKPNFPPASRGKANWAKFSNFGILPQVYNTKYIVSIDIASMYEYVDHGVLARELLIQTFDHPVVAGIADLLGEVYNLNRGLPQMMDSSDFLGDAYLGILERKMLRHGYSIARYADDFRILAREWGEAHQIIERAAEAARSIGLVLSSEKTKIHKVETLANEELKIQEALSARFNRDSAGSVSSSDIPAGYDNFEDLETNLDGPEFPPSALFSLVEEAARTGLKEPTLPRLVPMAIKLLQNSTSRLSDDIVGQLIWRDPLRLSSIAEYMQKRAGEPELNLRTLAVLTEAPRQSPWSKIWLLNLAGCNAFGRSDEFSQLKGWVVKQMYDEHEVVRAEASWAAAQMQLLDANFASRLFGEATALTRPGIAAALGRMRLDHRNPIVRSFVHFSPLIRGAYNWGADDKAGA